MTSNPSPDRPVLQPLPWMSPPDCVVRLSPDSLAGLGLVRISGEQAASFLHGQLTQDVIGLPEGQARGAGRWCARVRMSGAALLWRGGVGWVWGSG